jgi:hypothetical protein
LFQDPPGVVASTGSSIFMHLNRFELRFWQENQDFIIMLDMIPQIPYTFKKLSHMLFYIGHEGKEGLVKVMVGQPTAA